MNQDGAGVFKSHFNNVIIIAGNHDTSESGPGSIADFRTNCPFPLAGITPQYDSAISSGYGYEYYFDYPSTNPLARFIMITPNVEGEIDYAYIEGSTHFNWVVNSVNAARTAGIPWVIVGMHKQCFTMGEKNGCPSSSEHSDHGMHDLVHKLISLKVDLILQAHEHNYQRSKQLALNPATCPEDPKFPHQPDTADTDCVVDDGADRYYVKGSGTVIVITGTGGNSGVDPCVSSDVEAPYVSQCIGSGGLFSHGSTRFAVGSSSSTPFIAANFIPNKGGYLADSFVISNTAPPVTLTFNPTADSWIDQANQGSNHGADSVLEADTSPIVWDILVKYSVNGLLSLDYVTNAKFRMLVTEGSSSGGGKFYETSSTWEENAVTWSNAPSIIEPVRTSMGAVATNTWYDIDITYAISGNGVESFRILGSGSDGVTYASRETANKPTLTVTYLATGGGSVAEGTLITLANDSRVPVQNLVAGTQIRTWDTYNGVSSVATVVSIDIAIVSNMLVISTNSGPPLRVDINPNLRLHILLDGRPTLRPVTELQVGDLLFSYTLNTWIPVASIQEIYGGQHTYYDIHIAPSSNPQGNPLDFIADGYGDCPCKLGSG